MSIKVLNGHTSPATAYVVEDYPYGFRLRCKIRYWLELVPRKGVRFWSQTTNPKRPAEVWNKPKASTFARFAGCMFLDEQNHVQWSGCSEYMTLQELLDWQKVFGAGIPEPSKEVLAKWITLKTDYNESKARGEVKIITTTTSDGKSKVEEETLKPEVIRQDEPTLYGELKAAGVPLDNHESDLYFLDTPAAREVLARFPFEASKARSFVCVNDGNNWLDVPFAFLPWWKARQGKAVAA